ncbi:MAG: MATE family efflux transporter [Eubacteriales bacterium]|nr:MATE family efflux transporter [Eubacteriales bacterium]
MIDMTVGSPRGHLWRHALPLLLGNWLQLSYNAIDSMIAGRFLGQNALAAEGIAGPVMNLVILAITGLCIGAGVLMSEAFGAKDYERFQRILANMLMAGFAVCCTLALAGILLARQILSLLAVPQEIYDITAVYLRITFLGAPFTFCYNALTAGLKSVGDADTPLKFLAFSAILNAVLDIIFLGILRFGIVCSAMTTVFAEAVCAALALGYSLRHMGELCPRGRQWRLRPELLKQILRYGGPTTLQQAIQPVCKVLIQGQVNTLGVSSIAAFNAVTRADDFACIPAQSVSSAISTYIAQNRGAEKYQRIRPGFRCGIRLEFCYWLLIGSVVAVLRKPMVSMFVTGEGSEEVIALGSRYLAWMAAFYLFPAMTNGVQGFFRGMGKMYTTMLATFIQASIRTVCTYILVPRMGIVGIAFSCAIGWSVMLLYEVPLYFLTCRRQGLEREML